MYKSPIEVYQDEIETFLEGEILKAVQRVGVSVDKEELLKALEYDRGQYDKGYADAVAEFTERCKEHILCQTFGLHPKNIDEIAEQMKGGAE